MIRMSSNCFFRIIFKSKIDSELFCYRATSMSTEMKFFPHEVEDSYDYTIAFRVVCEFLFLFWMRHHLYIHSFFGWVVSAVANSTVIWPSFQNDNYITCSSSFRIHTSQILFCIFWQNFGSFGSYSKSPIPFMFRWRGSHVFSKYNWWMDSFTDLASFTWVFLVDCTT